MRKRILIFLSAIGAAVSLYYAYSLIFFHAHAEISFLHIAYISDYIDPFWLIAIALYLIVTLAPFFVSGIKHTNILGIIIGLSFIVSVVFFTKYLVSVWCFFAAVVSFIIFYTIRDGHKKLQIKKQVS